MYYYFYHSDLHQNKYSKLVMDIDSGLHKLGLEGNTTKLGRYASFSERLQEIQLTNQDTLVIVGDDELFTQAVNHLAENQSRPTLGYIPITQASNLTRNLGVPAGEKAVMVLANRRIDILDVGVCNRHFFLQNVKIKVTNIEMSIDKKYTVSTPDGVSEIMIQNLSEPGLKGKKVFSNPHDGKLEVLFLENEKNFFNQTQKKIQSAFVANKITVTAKENIEALLDNNQKTTTPLEVGVLKKAVKVIVGKQRLLNRIS